MSNLRWERTDGGRVWTLIGEIPWPGADGRTHISGQPVGYVYESPAGWGVVTLSKYMAGEYMTTVDTLDEAKALLQTVVGAQRE